MTCSNTWATSFLWLSVGGIGMIVYLAVAWAFMARLLRDKPKADNNESGSPEGRWIQ